MKIVSAGYEEIPSSVSCDAADCGCALVWLGSGAMFTNRRDRVAASEGVFSQANVWTKLELLRGV